MPKTDRPAADKTRLQLERHQGVFVHGWVWDPITPGTESLALQCGNAVVAVKVERVERADVVQALGLDPTVKPGFSLELPAEIWPVLDASGIRITVNAQAMQHAPLWPDYADMVRWTLHESAEEGRAPAEAERMRALLVAHGEAAARHPPLASRPANAFKTRASPMRLTVEGLRGLRIFGWTLESIDPEKVEIRVGERRLGVPFVRCEREDVARAFGLDDARVGFEAEIPGEVWQLAPGAAQLDLHLCVDGKPHGPVMTLSREGLLRTLGAVMAIGDVHVRRTEALLCMEHLVLTDQITNLSLTQRTWLAELTEGIRPKAWLASAGDQAAEPAPNLQWRRLPQAPRVIGRLLRSRWFASLALRLLAWRSSPGKPSGLELALTRRIGLFDRHFYSLQASPDGNPESLGMPPLRHYLEVGQARGLSPMILLDPGHYIRQLPGRQPPPINPLLHYALHGRFAGLTPCPWFDERHYLGRHEDVRRAGVDPLAHFHDRGHAERRPPLPDFNTDISSRDSIGLRVSRLNARTEHHPLLDYLRRGLPVGVPGPRDGRPPWFGQCRLDGRDFLDRRAWETVSPPEGEPRVDVVVPVYAGHQETLRSLWAVLTQAQATCYELVVIDDCGPEPVLREMLAWLASRGLFTLLVNPANLGFVRSVNRGLELHPDRDVVILNADTRVHGNWLDRLLAHARSEPRAASITPLSNNATVCSYPRTLDANDELSLQESTALDALAARVNAGQHVSVPTGVGFCMWMRRDTMRQVGLLDAERFGRGYGEENDWCLRAAREGWQHLIAADIYVTHSGSVSFGGEASPRVQEALRLIRETFPDYPRRIEAHIAADPLRAARVRLDAARLQARAEGGFVLSVNHERGGGTTRHEREQFAALRERGLQVLALRPAAGLRVHLVAPDGLACPNLADLDLTPGGLLDEALSGLDLREIHVHHLADFADTLPEVLRRLATSRGARLVVTVHDYHLLCPRINLVGPDGRYCGLPQPQDCNRCLAADGLAVRAGTIEAWRRRHGALLQAAAQVRVPDEDLLPRLAQVWPTLQPEVHPHEPDLQIERPRAARRQVQQVLVIGALSPIKGLHVVKAVAASPAARELGLHFTLLGFSADDAGLREAGVEVLGAYDDEQLLARIKALGPDLIFLPSIWPETYSYVLSAAMRSRRRVAMFDIGAPARRARAANVQPIVLPLALAQRPDDLARALHWGLPVD